MRDIAEEYADKLSIRYEPQSQKWQYQKVTGDIPAKVKYPCVVGQEGDDGTYEIFLYGGLGIRGQTATIEQSGSVHVLSLPSFNWVKEDTSPDFGRIWPTCQVIGNRHMAVVGGMTEYRDSPHFDPDDDSYGEGQAVDPWRHGT